MAGLGLIGPAMAMYGEAVSVWEQVNTGDLTGKIFFTDSDQGNIGYYDGMKAHRITFDIEENEGVCNFELENQGTIPVRILSPTIMADTALNVEYDLPRSLEPGESYQGQIVLYSEEAGSCLFQLDIECIQWNAYNDDPDWWRDMLRIDGTITWEETDPLLPAEELGSSLDPEPAVSLSLP